MAAPLLLALLALLVLALGLVAVGLRGRRINDHPLCRQCRFDLQGVYPPAITCPECGAGLKRAAAIVHGARRRRWILCAAGLALAAGPLVSILALAYGLATGLDLNRYKPAPMLIWEAGHADGPAALPLIKELLTRYNASRLADADITRAVEAGLALQADPARAWLAEWGDLIEAANTDDKIDDALFKRYLDHTIVLEAEARPAVAQGDPIPVLIKLKETRCGPSLQAHAMLSFSAARAAGLELRRTPSVSAPDAPAWTRAMLGRGPSMLAWFQIAGPGSRMGFMGTRPQAARLLLDSVCVTETPAPLATGDHTVEIDCSISVQVASRTGNWTFDDQAPGEKVSLTIPLRITPPGEGLRIVQPDAELARQIREAIRPSTVVIMNHGGDERDDLYVHMLFHPGKLPVGLAFDVLFKSPDKTWRLGSLISGRSADNTDGNLYYGIQDDSIERQIYGQIGTFSLDAATIVLRPNPELALRTLDMDSVYNETITFEDFPVQWQGEKPGPNKPKRRGFLERFLFGG